LADVELPDGTEFTQYVLKLRRCVMIAVLDEPGTSILLLRRHRFIIDRWVWEIPGGYWTTARTAMPLRCGKQKKKQAGGRGRRSSFCRSSR